MVGKSFAGSLIAEIHSEILFQTRLPAAKGRWVVYYITLSRVGNFILGASGCYKQTFCGSSTARGGAAPTISVVNKIIMVGLSSAFYGVDFQKQGENSSVLCLLTCFLV